MNEFDSHKYLLMKMRKMPPWRPGGLRVPPVPTVQPAVTGVSIIMFRFAAIAAAAVVLATPAFAADNCSVQVTCPQNPYQSI